MTVVVDANVLIAFALAARLDCDFWTADERLVNSVRTRFNHIHWLGHWTLSAPPKF
jgi:hypothetical protein